ncbi:hypothetical protein HPL003_15085 [Paenibacillus terrae HPL-003]|uniref:Uncharacterized protein n=1 Tax=Paenibacillus terrae (strain HPL-003) TaxID=985665 RepID=G7W4D0_PAETH|nr:hypothetical protein HPL003_15085 [Paenibacillus terrae HPL-003]
MKAVNAHVWGTHSSACILETEKSFQLVFDTDAHWIAYVIEEGKFAYTIREHQGEANARCMILCPPEEVFHR